MQELIAGLHQFTFAFEEDVETQRGIGLLPFQGMDKSSSAVCNFFSKGVCGKGKRCPFRHDIGGKTVVCKHWLRGLCTKGDQCNFLHQYDTARMPACYFFSKFGDCNNKECPFLHLKPASNACDCPWYDQGFCKDGPLCRYRHIQKVMCINYLAGFCPEGPRCHFAHPKMNLSLSSPSYLEIVNRPRGSASPASVVKPPRLPSLTETRVQESLSATRLRPGYPLQVPYYMCQKTGHYALQCRPAQPAGLIGKQPMVWEIGRPVREDMELLWDALFPVFQSESAAILYSARGADRTFL